MSYFALGDVALAPVPSGGGGETVLTQLNVGGQSVKITVLTAAATISLLLAAYNVFVSTPRHFKRIERKLGLKGD